MRKQINQGDSIGFRIEKLRLEKRETQEQLASALNVTRTAVNKWESNASKPSRANLEKMSNHFGVPADYLMMQIAEPVNLEVAKIYEYVGLSSESVELLHELSLSASTHYLDAVLSTFGRKIINNLNSVGYLCNELQASIDTIEKGEPVSPEQYANHDEYRKRLELALFRFSKMCDRIPDVFGAWSLLNRNIECRSPIILNKPPKEDVERIKAWADSELNQHKENANYDSCGE